MCKQEVAYWECLLGSVDFLLSHLPYNDGSRREDINSHYDVLDLDSITEAGALGKLVMGPWADGYLFCSAIQFSQYYKIQSREREEEDSDSDGTETISTEENKYKKRAILEVEDVTMYYNRETAHMRSSNFSRKAHHAHAFEHAVHVWREASSYGDRYLK